MGGMRAEAISSMRALILVLLLLASTQLILLTARDYAPQELEALPQRYDADNSGVASIELGETHACVIGTDSQMKCWGDGTYGKTGHENAADYGDEEEEMGRYLLFTDVGVGLTFSDVALGQDFTCALINDASVKCWGENEQLGSSAGASDTGAMGDGYLEMGDNVEAVALGYWNATAVAVGRHHACAIVNDGASDSLVCWGQNGFGQLGLGSTDTIGDTDADLVSGELPHVDLPDRGEGLAQVALGDSHTCLLWDDGEMSCWGYNWGGQLGIGSTDDIGDEAGEMGDDLELVDLPSGRTARASPVDAGQYVPVFWRPAILSRSRSLIGTGRLRFIQSSTSRSRVIPDLIAPGEGAATLPEAARPFLTSMSNASWATRRDTKTAGLAITHPPAAKLSHSTDALTLTPPLLPQSVIQKTRHRKLSSLVNILYFPTQSSSC